MAWFSAAYEPGGKHHVKITDEDFHAAQLALKENEDLLGQAERVAKSNELSKYDARDFPVAEIIGSFFTAYQLRQKKLGIAEDLRMGIAELGRKERVEYDKYVNKLVEKDEFKSRSRQESWDNKGLGGKLFSVASRAAAAGIASAATGKSSDLRNFEKYFSNYICGDSIAAKSYLLGFAKEFGAEDDGVLDVSAFLRSSYWLNEFVRNTRG